jgi:hypothetical protein
MIIELTAGLSLLWIGTLAFYLRPVLAIARARQGR